MAKTNIVTLRKQDEKFDTLVTKVKNSMESIEKEFVALAFNLRALYQYCVENGLSFSAVVDGIGLSPQKAHKLLGVADMMVRYKCTIKDVRQIGYTKASTIAPVLSKQNYKRWIDAAHKLNTVALIEAIKGKKPPKATVIFTANLTMKQNQFVVDTLLLAGAEKIHDSAISNRGATLVKICEEYRRMVSNGKSKKTSKKAARK